MLFKLASGNNELSAPIGTERNGFTLIELVVIIATVAIVAGLLLPALAVSKSRAQQIGCLDNIRQLNVALQMYAADHDGKIVANNNGSDLPSWVEGGAAGRTPPYGTSLAVLGDPQFSLFARYVSPGDLRIYKCPADPGNNPVLASSSTPRLRSYALNSFMGWEGALYHGQGNSTAPYRVFKRLSDVGGEVKNSKGTLSPATAFTFQDVHPWSICWPFFGMWLDHSAWYHFPATFHDGASSIGFADGHVESHRWRMPSTTPSLGMIGNPPQHLGSHDYPVPISQTEDLFWMQDHTSGKR